MKKFEYNVSVMPPVESAHPQNLANYLAKYGAEGWELVSCVPVEENVDFFIFKKEIE